MSTIRTVSDAYEALCAGEYFQIGGLVIDPEDIVRVDRSFDQPKFWLSDGSTIQHDRFEKGDVGDLLAEALEIATRGSQTEILKPVANQFFDVSTANNYIRVLDSDGALLGKEINIPDNRYDLQPEARFSKEIGVVTQGKFPSVHRKFDLLGNLVAENTNGIATSKQICYLHDDGTAWFYNNDSTDTAVERLNDDGSLDQLSINSGSSEGDAFAATDQTATPYAVIRAGGSLQRIALDGSNTSATYGNVGAVTGSYIDIKDGFCYYAADATTVKRIDITNISATPETVANIGAVDMGGINGGVMDVEKNRLTVKDEVNATGEAFIYSMDQGDTVLTPSDKAFSFIDAGLDQSRV